MFSQKILPFETSFNCWLFCVRICELFSLLQKNEEYFSANNRGHFLCQSTVRGNKAEPGVNTLHVHTVPGTVSDKPCWLICNGDNRQYVCAVCGKGCSHAGILRVHNVIHTGEIPYLRQLCGEKFVTRRELKKRGLSHTEEKPHVCAWRVARDKYSVEIYGDTYWLTQVKTFLLHILW